MIAARSARDWLGNHNYERTINNLDWNRVMIEARGLHMRLAHADESPCGTCVRVTLLQQEPAW